MGRTDVQSAALLDVDPHVRRDDDYYPTPAWMTRALLARLRDLESFGQVLRIIEPCVGDGAIVRVLPEACDIVTNDVVVRRPMSPDYLLDATRPDAWRTFAEDAPIDVVITNPPFNQAFKIAEQAVRTARLGVALLLRLSWLEPTQQRGEWLAAHPPTSIIVMPRHDFRGNGATDSVTSAWYVWASPLSSLLAAPGVSIVTLAERTRLQQEGR